MLKVLEMEDMKYLDSVIAEVFGNHAIMYNSEDRYCYLANPIPLEIGEVVAIGIKEEDEMLTIMVKTKDGETIAVNAIEI